MKAILLAVAVLLASLAFAQQNVKRVFLSPKSNIATGEISEGFSKYCPNVVLTQHEEKADYLLEAFKDRKTVSGTSNRRWYLTLMNLDGDILVATTNSKNSKQDFEAVCTFINKAK
jgi:hypothetical protein